MSTAESKRLQKFDRCPGIVTRSASLDLYSLPRIDAHLHTSWTDGSGKVAEVYAAAVQNRLAAIVYSEHSRKSSADWFPAFAAEVRALPSSPCRAYVGTECKVESRDGAVDTAPAIFDLCDFVTVSVHRFPSSDGTPLSFANIAPEKALELEFELTWAVLGNPITDILGHMFGMSIRRFKVYPAEDKFRALIARAAEFGVAVEINTRYHAEPWKLIQWCRESDALITFGSDAHSVADVGANVRLLNSES